jgi:biopolymer transport protein ExbD
MRSARRALRELERNELANKGEVPINLVPMIDILTVLVLYLLVGSIFRHFTVLTLNMPNTAPVQVQDKPPLELTVTVRAAALEISDRLGALQKIDNVNGTYDLNALTTLLLQIKQKTPDETAINLLLEPDIEYDVLVHVIDAVRLWPDNVALPEGVQKTPGKAANLFPAIAIGDAPKLDGQP